MSGIRFHVEPGDVPANVAAKRIGLSIDAFYEKLPALIQHGFPAANPVTGNYCLEAVDVWRKAFYPHLLPAQLTPAPAAHDARLVVRQRLREVSGG